MASPLSALFGPALGFLGGLLGGSSSSSQNSTGNSATQTNSSGSSNSSSELQSLMSFLQQLSSFGSTSNTQTTTPNLNPQSQAFINKLTSQYGQLTNPSLTGYEANQTANINQNADAQTKAVDAIMASRGLSTSPVAGTTDANIQQNRLNQITGMQQQIPLLQNNLNLQNLGAAASFAAMLPGFGGATTSGGTTNQNTQTSTGTQTQNQTQNQWQNIWNYLNSQSNQNSATYGKQSSGLLSDKRLKKEIKPVEKALEKIRELKPSTWKWKGGETSDVGVIAQDLEKILPDLVHEDDSLGPVPLRRVNYIGLLPYLIGAVQDIDKKLEAVNG